MGILFFSNVRPAISTLAFDIYKFHKSYEFLRLSKTQSYKQRTNGPVHARIISGSNISTKHTKLI